MMMGKTIGWGFATLFHISAISVCIAMIGLLLIVISNQTTWFGLMNYIAWFIFIAGTCMTVGAIGFLLTARKDEMYLMAG